MRQTIEALASDDSEKFLEHTKLELFHDQVFCFTPKGRLIALPRGATAIDFAYAVHTDVGNSAVGAKINGRIAPLISELHNGDEVLISRSEGGSPPAAWDSVVVTGRARAAIRRATREAAKAQFGGLGRQIVERAFERAGKKFAEAKAGCPRLARASVDDVFIGVGRGEILPPTWCGRSTRTSRSEGRALRAPKRERMVRPAEGGRSHLPRTREVRRRRGAAAARHRSRYARALRAQGRGGPGRAHRRHSRPDGIIVYPIHSPALVAYDDRPELWLDVRWDLENTPVELYSTQIDVTLLNEPGALGVIATTIGEYGANIDAVSSSPSGADFREVRVDLQVRDIQHLNAILSQLRGKSVVHKVERLSG